MQKGSFMKYLVTTCCKEKRNDKKLLPVIDRYLDPRLRQVFNISKDLNTEFLILSGKYGLLRPNDLIPYYDQILTDEQVAKLVERVLNQLQTLKVSELIIYGKDKNTNQSWKPYYAVLQSACEKLKILYSEEIVVTPKIFSLVGDFSSGKTSLRREFSKYDKYFIGNDLFAYLHADEFNKFDLEKDKPKAFRLNYYRDLLLESSKKEVAVYDEDVLELLAYEFSCIVRSDSNIFDSLKSDLKLYRSKKPYLYPIGYIDLRCPIDVSEKRISIRDLTERITPDYFKSSLTKIAYRKFYDELFKYIPNNRKLQIDTSLLSLKDVFATTEAFINRVLLEDFALINVFDYLDKLDLVKMKEGVLSIYDKTR